MANTVFIFFRESIVVLTKDSCLSVNNSSLHTDGVFIMDTSGTRASVFHGVICSQSRQQVQEHCVPKDRLVYWHMDAQKGL